MATSDNERYLRYILLLGKGGPLVLKGILKREAKTIRKPLSQILLDNSSKLRQLIRNDSQYECIFPAAGSVNDDLDNWDTSLLCLVILNIFGSILTPQERIDIKSLRTFRNEIHGHSASLALSENEFHQYRTDLNVVLLNLTSGIDRLYHDECQELIKSTKSGPLEISSTLEDFKEFQTELLTLIKVDSGANSIKLDDICKEIKKIQGTTMQQKELAEENHSRLCKIENSQDEIRQNVEVTNVQQRELAEESHRYFCKSEKGQDEIIQMLKHVKEMLKREAEASTNGNTDIQEDVETELHIQSKNDETASSAEDMLVQKINELLREINSAPEPKTINEEHVRKRVQRYLQTQIQYPNEEELTLAVMELMIDIFKQSGTTILPAEKCCIRFVVRCKSYTGLLGLLEYLESKAFDQRIQDIATALSKHTDISVFITVVVSAHSLQQIKKNLMQTQITTGSCEPRNRTVTLPVRSRNIRSIEHVWKLFQEEDINHHLLNISRILSTIVGGNIEITSSINLKKLKQSLQNIESKDPHTSHDESKTVTSEEKLDEVSTCRLNDALLLSLALSDVFDDIGVNEKNVMKERKAVESLRNISGKAHERIYLSGSHSEGTTTSGLDSDLDVYMPRNDICLNQSCDQKKHKVFHAILVQNENMPPGHYYLQKEMLNICSNYVHTAPCHINVCLPCYDRRVKIGSKAFLKPELKKYLQDKECFLVPSPLALTENANFEWKIYHSFAERCLMLNLNIVQIRCYVMMKIIIESHLHPLFRLKNSNAVYKAVLFYCIENSNLEIWREYNFWLCLSNCLKVLYQFVSCGSCPHFLDWDDNLISRQLSQAEKELIVQKLQNILQDGWHFIFGIEIDGFGQRLKDKCFLPSVLLPREYSCYKKLCSFFNDCYHIKLFLHILKKSIMSNPKPMGDVIIISNQQAFEDFLIFIQKVSDLAALSQMCLHVINKKQSCNSPLAAALENLHMTPYRSQDKTTTRKSNKERNEETMWW